jgi:lipid-binding SYLF domain-containing protein
MICTEVDKEVSITSSKRRGIGSLIKINGGAVPEKKNYHLTLKGDSIKRLEYLQGRVGNGTQAEVIANALQLFEEILRNYDNGSVFYIKHPEDNDPIEFNIFECS